MNPPSARVENLAVSPAWGKNCENAPRVNPDAGRISDRSVRLLQ